MTKFDLLLVFMAGRMQYLSHHHAGFMAMLHNRQFVIQLQTSDMSSVRYFSIKNRRIRSHAQAHNKPDFSLSFKDADYAVKILSKATPMAFMKGMQEGNIKMEGDFGLLMWFNNAAKYLQPDVPKPVRQAIKWVKSQRQNKRQAA
ncbi:SCP2 sterol-binding domain-containing protein [Agitococcus lubricus]|uniref:SCP-2 sterol transfer family protein n=1 Tax=Agitococcus lubricus TaxID=1077255 RepID=A0A2T5J3C7_9GAMM|nr:SCP2 sterol-binding domain-containing protein [Agitococcus lubricus]PTQ91038.1 SCP-2 sterol transfer family protein [Agitococcus lubricus]